MNTDKSVTMRFIAGLLSALCLAGLSVGNPVLTPGVWKNISPPGVDLSGFGIPVIQIDRGNPDIIYCNPDAQGIWKSTDAGSTWTLLGTKPASPDWTSINAGHVTYLDCYSYLEIDPANSSHIYAAQGVRGNTFGFWISTDGGASWDKPQGYKDASAIVGNSDLGSLRVDPTDFKHILLVSHSTWKNSNSFGILESTDGGNTFIIHQPYSEWGGGSMSLNILYDPSTGFGNFNTWMVTCDGQGGWRTTNSGATWASIPSLSGKAPHGGTSIYIASTGVLYAPATPYPVRSTDGGLTWAQITNGIPFNYYNSIIGDGNTLYTLHSYGVNGTPYSDPYLCSSEQDGLSWTAYQGGAQKLGNGPYMMKFDKKNRIMYSANWGAGLWALKVIDSVTGTTQRSPTAIHGHALTIRMVGNARTGISIRTASGKFYDVQGRTAVRKR